MYARVGNSCWILTDRRDLIDRHNLSNNKLAVVAVVVNSTIGMYQAFTMWIHCSSSYHRHRCSQSRLTSASESKSAPHTSIRANIWNAFWLIADLWFRQQSGLELPWDRCHYILNKTTRVKSELLFWLSCCELSNDLIVDQLIIGLMGRVPSLICDIWRYFRLTFITPQCDLMITFKMQFNAIHVEWHQLSRWWKSTNLHKPIAQLSRVELAEFIKLYSKWLIHCSQQCDQTKTKEWLCKRVKSHSLWRM